MTLTVDDRTALVPVSEQAAYVIYPLFMADISELKEIFSFATENYRLEDELHFIRSLPDDDRFSFYIYRDGKPCGKIGLYDYNERVRAASLLYWVASGYRRQQIARNSTRLLLRYAFEDLNINRVQFFINTDNTQSVGLVKKLGCTYEGTLRDNDWVNGRFHTQVLYSCLANEFENLKVEI